MPYHDHTYRWMSGLPKGRISKSTVQPELRENKSSRFNKHSSGKKRVFEKRQRLNLISSHPNPPRKDEDCLRQPVVAGALTMWIQAQVHSVRPKLT